MSQPKAPAPPDPRAQARATLGSNVTTAKANNWMQLMDQSGPFGSTTHHQAGTTSFTDPYSGAVIEVPRYAAETNLSGPEQAVYDANTDNRLGAAGAMGTALTDWEAAVAAYNDRVPDSITGDAISARADEIAGPEFRGDYLHRVRQENDRRAEREMARLDAQGVVQGSEAWEDFNRRLYEMETDSVNEALLRGRSQDWQERSGARRLAWSELVGAYDRDMDAAVRSRTLPIGEIGALAGLSPVNAPGTQPILPGGFSGIDAAALEDAAYGHRKDVYKRKMTSWDNIMATLGDIGANAVSAA